METVPQKIARVVEINDELKVSKYRQIVNSIKSSITVGKLKIGDKLPSINRLCLEYEISRDTVLYAYNELRNLGIINAIHGKAFFVQSTKVNYSHKVFLMFDEMNMFKEDLYNSIIHSLGDDAVVDLYFHYFNRVTFNTFIRESLGRYSDYVLMPSTFTGIETQLKAINNSKIALLDQYPADLCDEYNAVYQNFEKNILNGLISANGLLPKYSKIIMVHPGGKEPEGLITGFIGFCRKSLMPFELLCSLEGKKLNRGEAYFIIDDRDLVTFIEMAKAGQLEIGHDVGVVSYNDTPLKKVLAGGITTISNDFSQMGRILSQIVLGKVTGKIEAYSSLIVRNSL